MAEYNTFIVVDTKSRKPILTTSSARKASRILVTGHRIDVWCENRLTDVIYERDLKRGRMTPYFAAEKEYIRRKQARAEERNKRRYG